MSKKRWYTLLGCRIDGEYKREIDAVAAAYRLQRVDNQLRIIETRKFLLSFYPRVLYEWENPVSLMRTVAKFVLARRNRYTGKIHTKL